VNPSHWHVVVVESFNQIDSSLAVSGRQLSRVYPSHTVMHFHYSESLSTLCYSQLHLCYINGSLHQLPKVISEAFGIVSYENNDLVLGLSLQIITRMN